MPGDGLVEKSWCNTARMACAAQIKERYEAMKELFNSKLDGVADQLESTLQDLQRSLSAGSARMDSIESTVKSIDTKLREDIKEVHARIDDLLKTREVRFLATEQANSERFDFVAAEIKEINKPPWNLITIIVMVILAVAGSFLITWKTVGINEEQMKALRQQVQELKTDIHRDKAP